jgi:hypothetical protein
MGKRRVLLGDPSLTLIKLLRTPDGIIYRMTKSRSLYLAIAIFTLAVQVAAAGHSPALHEEPVSKCHDQGAHFCPDGVEHETGPCVLCHVSLNGVYLERIQPVESGGVSEPIVARTSDPAVRSVPPDLHSPRGPPVG